MSRLIDADALNRQIISGKYIQDWETVTLMIALVGRCPAIDAEPVRHGRWIPDDKTDPSKLLKEPSPLQVKQCA